MGKCPRCSASSLAAAAALAASLSVAQAQEIEIEFEPMDGPMSGAEKDFISMLQQGPPVPASKHGKEAQLDDVLNAMLTDLASAAGPPPGLRGKGGGGGGMKMMQGLPDGVEVLEIGPAIGPPPGKSAFPAAMFRDLFPGPVMMGMPQLHPMPFDEPDPHVQGLVKDLDATFLNLMGNIQKAASADHMPNACGEDLKKFCTSTNKKLHCLGQHASEISEACHKDVGKSVPFRCSSSIDRFCNVLEDGILNCLGQHVKELPSECQDAVLATHHVISKANSQKATVVDVNSGAKQESKPSEVATTPKPLEGAPPVHTMAHQLPSGVLDLLGKARSTLSAEHSAGSYRMHFLLITLFIAGLAFTLYRLQQGDAWENKQLRNLLQGDQGESLKLTADNNGVEIAKKPQDMQAFGA